MFPYYLIMSSFCFEMWLNLYNQYLLLGENHACRKFHRVTFGNIYWSTTWFLINILIKIPILIIIHIDNHPLSFNKVKYPLQKHLEIWFSTYPWSTIAIQSYTTCSEILQEGEIPNLHEYIIKFVSLNGPH